ncbi:SAV_915 family protein [Streptomyces sp. NPDC002055]|uniref:SAV_915 family protein n=1 Tax=Streptomyces sp. NPDC002055 TaxID=3154534 RepID=UPI0033271735
MSPSDHAEDPEPSEPVPAGPLFVPVRSGPAGCAARFFRTPPGGRTAVGFTSEERLFQALGKDQDWVRISLPALRALAAPAGVTALTLDPQFSAPAPVARSEPERAWPDWDPRHLRALRVTAAAAVVSCIDLLIG